jgi:VanZ family protein
VSRSHFGLAALLYALLIAYASTVIGPLGFNYVPIDPHEALSRLIHIPYVENGSDQRSDWMGNLAMLVPMGFLLTGFLSPRHRLSVTGAIAALILCAAFILAVKYAQLFFPPRTVSLNYVIAQSVGALCGVILFGGLRDHLAALSRESHPLETLRLILAIYTALVLLFFLTPLDFALNARDLAVQLDRLPDSFTAITGDGRPTVVRAVLIVADIVAMMPAGALLTFMGRPRLFIGRSTAAATGLGFLAMFAVYALTILVISGAPSLPAVAFRTLGVALGASTMRALTRQSAESVRHGVAMWVPWIVPIYLLGLAAVNGLLSSDWTTPEAGYAAMGQRSLFPLYNYYIVSKSSAAKNIAAHVVMYAPIGVMVWLRAKHDGGRGVAFVLASLLSLAVEFGRLLRPGLEGDINAVPLAGISAWAAAAAMPAVWRIVGAVAIGRGIPLPLSPSRMRAGEPGRGDRVNAPGGRPDETIGDVEEY